MTVSTTYQVMGNACQRWESKCAEIVLVGYAWQAGEDVLEVGQRVLAVSLAGCGLAAHSFSACVRCAKYLTTFRAKTELGSLQAYNPASS